MNKTLRGVVGLIISAVCLWFVFRGFDFAHLKTALANASYGWAIPAAFIFVTNFVLRTWRWKILLSPLTSISIPALFPILTGGFFLNNILPARTGEFARAYAISRKQNIPTSSSLGSIVVERLFDFSGLALIIVIASALLPWSDLPLVPVVGLASVLAIGVLVFTLFVSKFKHLADTGPSWLRKILHFLFQIPAGFLSLKSPQKIAAVVGLSFMIWINEALQVYFISRVTHLVLRFAESAGVLMGLSVGVMIPAAPGYIGTYELFGKEILVKIGYPPAESLTFVLVLHFFQLLSMAVLGLPALLKWGPDLRKPT